jgi:hypothetical protein
MTAAIRNIEPSHAFSGSAAACCRFCQARLASPLSSAWRDAADIFRVAEAKRKHPQAENLAAGQSTPLRDIPSTSGFALAATTNRALNRILSAMGRNRVRPPQWQPPCITVTRKQIKATGRFKPRRATPMTLMTAMHLPILFGLLVLTYCGVKTVSFRRMKPAPQKFRQR